MSSDNFTDSQCLELVELTANASQTFDPDVTHTIFISCLTMWAIGLTVGIIFSLIRKMK